MDRETLAQAVAMLVVLAALARWLPPGEPGDTFGRGDPWHALGIDRSLRDEPPESRQGAAMLRAMFRRDGSIGRWRRLLEQVDVLRGRTGPGDVIQLRGVSRNELWPLAYDLYPARVIGMPTESGGSARDPLHPDATWVLTSRGFKDEPVLEAGPAHADRRGAAGPGRPDAGGTPR